MDDATAGSRRVVAALVRDVPDHPVPGILFRDITPVLGDPVGLRACIDGLVRLVPAGVDVVAAVEARGFVLGAPMALALGTGFVPVRKAGKLPGPTRSARYGLEYGTDEIEVPADAFLPGQRVLVVDDVLATGGTAAAACGLVESAGAEVAAVVVLIELEALGGRGRLVPRELRSLLAL